MSGGGDQGKGIGGIAGKLKGLGNKINNCYADVEITTENVTFCNSGAGGIVGDLEDAVTVSNCYAMGVVDAAEGGNGFNTGGIVGRSYDFNGGIPEIKNCIAWQTLIDGRAAVGRICGRNHTSNASQNCYANADMEIWLGDSLHQGALPTHNSSATDRAEDGTDCDNLISTAQTLGWDSSIWNFSGTTPQLNCFKK